MRALALLLLLGAFLATPVLAQETPATSPPSANRLVTRELPLGNADLTQVDAMISQTKSEGGSHKFLKVKRTVIITDTPETIEGMRAILGELSKQAAMNVRIDVTVRSMGQSRTSGVDVGGRITTGNVRGRFGTTPPRGGMTVPAPAGTAIITTPGTTIVTPGGNTVIIPGNPVIVPGTVPATIPGRPGGGFTISGSKGTVRVNPFDQKTGTNSVANQFILVGNGRAGVIEVVREVPMVDFFMGYSPRAGFILPTTRWEKAGTQLLVKPVVSGDLITVEVTPRISQVVFANKDVFSRKPLGRPLTGADQYITYTQLTSTVTVQNGATITIGGFQNASKEFNRYFFGGSTTTGQSVGSITLKATIQ